MPAEYSKESKNLTRDQWELEQSFQDYMLKDAKFCVAAAGSIGHFQFLMKRLGYEFKANEYLEVRIPGRKKYHKLTQLDKGFQEEDLRYQFNNPYMKQPYYHVNNIWRYSKGTNNFFQRGYYTKIYRLRMVEQKRFQLGSAYYAEELKKMHVLQERYFLMTKNKIDTPIHLLQFEISIENRQKEISERQKKIYRERSIRKRGIKDTSELFLYQQWHNRQQKELDQLKQQKKECRNQLKLIKAIWEDSTLPEFKEVLEYETIDEDAKVEIPRVSYYRYQMYDEIDKAEVIGIDHRMELNDVIDKVQSFYLANGYEVSYDTVFDEIQSIIGALKKEAEERRALIISLNIADKGGYKNLSYVEKAELFQFDIMDNSENLGIFMKVMKELGISMDFDELYEEYQKVYEVGMEREYDKKEIEEFGRRR